MDGFARILVTGAEGFVGRTLAAHLRRTMPGAHLIGTTRAPQDVPGFDETHAADLSHGDVPAVLALTRPDIVLHLAARSSVAEGISAAGETFADNMTASLALAGAMRTVLPGIPLVFASSGEVYGSSFNLECPVTEQTPPAPQNAYARSKLAGEFAFTDILGSVSPVLILRLFNHFGPGQDERFVIPTFAGQLRRMMHEAAPRRMRVGNLDATRDFLPVADVMAAYSAALSLARRRRAGAEVFNVASGIGRSIRSVLDDLIRQAGFEVTIEVDPARLRPSEVPKAVGNAEKFQIATGWTAASDWSDALSGML